MSFLWHRCSLVRWIYLWVEDKCMNKNRWTGPSLLFLALVLFAGGLAYWKYRSMKQSIAAAAQQPEPMEAVTVTVVKPQEYRRTTTTIGTVVALRSISLRNELPGTVHEVRLKPGEIVEPGAVLVALDTSVEEAELKAQEAQAALAETQLNRMEKAVQTRATAQMEVDRARAERDVAQAQIARAKAIIARKTIRAPFRARVGIAEVHPGQYLEAGTHLTTLQGVDTASYVDFSIPQHIAGALRTGDSIEVSTTPDQPGVAAEIVALDAKVDPRTRNVMVRARVAEADKIPQPGASVRVKVPAGPLLKVTSIPVNALRKGPAGDHVFLVGPGADGKPRATTRNVQTGPMLGDEILILAGLKPGDQIAAAGSFKLREGVLVGISTNNPAGAPAAQ
jgi:membrane fusion protein (multidrug efflux system)